MSHSAVVGNVKVLGSVLGNVCVGETDDNDVSHGGVTGGVDSAGADAVLYYGAGAVGVCYEFGCKGIGKSALVNVCIDGNGAVIDAAADGSALVCVAVGAVCISDDTADLVGAGHVAVIDAVCYRKTALEVLVAGVCNDTARNVSALDGAVVYAVLNGGALSGVAGDTACTESGGDVTVVGAVLYDYSVCSVVTDDTGSGNARIGVYGGDIALVVAVLEGRVKVLSLAADTAGGFRTGNGALVDAADELVGALVVVLTADAAYAGVAGSHGVGNIGFVYDVFKRCVCSLVGDSAYVALADGNGTDNGEVFDSTVHLFEHRNGYGHGFAVAVESADEVSLIGRVNGDVGSEIVHAVGGHVLEVICIVDGSSFGGEYADREKGNDHNKADDEGKCLAHDVYLFLLFVRTLPALEDNTIIHKKVLPVNRRCDFCIK